MSILDYVIIAVIFLWIIVAIYYIIRQKKAGRSVCCGSVCCGSNCNGSSNSPHCASCQKYCHQKKAPSISKPRAGSLRNLME